MSRWIPRLTRGRPSWWRRSINKSNHPVRVVGFAFEPAIEKRASYWTTGGSGTGLPAVVPAKDSVEFREGLSPRVLKLLGSDAPLRAWALLAMGDEFRSDPFSP